MLQEANPILFLAASLALIVAPGPDNILVLTRGIAQGQGAALVSAAGASVGLVIHSVFAAVGLSALLQQSAVAFSVVKYAGAAYLIYLGIKALIGGNAARPPSRGAPFRQGLVSNLLNPKMAVFYPTVIPQFVVPGDPLAMPLLLAAIHITLGVVWLPAYAWSVARLGNIFRSRWVERLTGVVLIALGVRLAVERR